MNSVGSFTQFLMASAAEVLFCSVCIACFIVFLDNVQLVIMFHFTVIVRCLESLMYEESQGKTILINILF